MDKQFLKSIALLDGMTTYHYKFILLLLEKERTQSQLAKELGIAKQNANKICKQLIDYGILYFTRIEGHNKFLAVNQNANFEMPGQMKIY